MEISEGRITIIRWIHYKNQVAFIKLSHRYRMNIMQLHIFIIKLNQLVSLHMFMFFILIEDIPYLITTGL
ncbi:hypothetical protein ED844_01580 [Escherichia coli]|nr:hypothetical protein [Escherichia coli]